MRRGVYGRRWRVLVVAAGLSAAVGVPPAALADPPEQNAGASLEGPVTGGVRGRPQTSSVVAIEPFGYVEEEYFVSGIATALPGAPSGTGFPLFLPTLPAGPSEPYATRIIARRPTDPNRFNGTVFVEWNNVSLETDLDSLWATSNDFLMEEGYAYVAVSAQKVGVDYSPMALKFWDPVRYGALSHPGDQFSWDIFAQATRAVLDCGSKRKGQTPGADPCPLDNLAHRYVIATGSSQSATTLATFINEVHDKRSKLFDGYLPQVAPIRDIRDDVAPVLWVNGESETNRGTSRAEPGKYYRYWEIAGASHGDIRQASYTLSMIARDQGNVPASATYNAERWEQYGERERGGSCPQNYFPSRWAVNAAVVAIDRWVRSPGQAPAILPPFERDASGAVVRDSDRNIKGGLRLPPMEVPVATYVGNECNLVGRMQQFSGEKLESLYPTHEDYVAKIRAATDRAVATGILLPRDAATLMRLAETSTIPEPWSG